MSVVLDIVRSYVRPREVAARRMEGVPREDRALAVLMGGCVLIFVAQLPRLAREAHVDPSIPFDGRMAGALFGWLMIMPLAFYAVALVLHGVLRLLGTAATGYRVRVAVFWALLASTPLWLLSGLTQGFLGPSSASHIVSGLALGGFLSFCVFGLVAAAGSAQETAA